MSYYWNSEREASSYLFPDDTVYPKYYSQNLEYKFLNSHIDPEFGLLDKLLGDDCLSSREYYSIREKGNRIEKNQQLLTIVKFKNLYPQLLETLNGDGQSHVTNFLHSKFIIVCLFADFIQQAIEN